MKIKFTELKDNDNRACLVNKESGKRFYLKNNVTIIGRKLDEVSIMIEDPYVGRRHCQIEKKDAAWILSDLNSLNGTGINGTLLNEEFYVLKENDIINIGKTELVFRLITDENSTM